MKKILFLLILLTSCTGIEDGIKDLESDTFGLKREAVVYSYTGQKIATYSGNSVRIDYSSDRVQLLIDGKRVHIINATVLIEEK